MIDNDAYPPREMSALTFGSLFAGIGGFDLGLERAGMVCKWQVEIDPFCQKVLKKHWPEVARYSDVREVGQHNLEPVDVICGGFPCQDVSLAGKRAGLEGKRSTLWGEYARIIRELRPRWVVAENVRGLFSSDGGQFFANILRDLAECGYDAEWDVLPAAAFGAPHIRERVFIVGMDTNAAGQFNGSFFGVRGVWENKEDENTRGICANGNVSNPNQPGLAQRKSVFGNDGTQQPPIERSDWWIIEPPVGRVANGVPNRVDRLRSLGNAVVPQVAEWIGRRIVEVNNDR